MAFAAPTPDQAKSLYDAGQLSDEQYHAMVGPIDIAPQSSDPTQALVQPPAVPDQNADMLQRAEQNPNGTIAPLTQGQALGLTGGIGHAAGSPETGGQGGPTFQNPMTRNASVVPAPQPLGADAELRTFVPRQPGEQGTPQTTVPGSTMPSGKTGGSGGGFTPSSADKNYKATLGETQNQMKANTAEEIAAGEAGFQAAQAQNDAQMQTRVAANQQMQADQVADQLRMQAAQKRAQQVSDQARAEVDRLQNEKIDPEHYWKEHGGAFGKTLAQIGAMMGAVAMVYGGFKTNPALDIINKNIDDDMASQKANLETRWKALDRKGALNDKDYNRAMDAAEQDTKGRLERYNAAIAVGDSAAMKYNNPQIAAAWGKTKAGLQEKALQVQNEYAGTVHSIDKAEENRRAAAAAAASAAQNRTSAELFKAALEMSKSSANDPSSSPTGKPLSLQESMAFLNGTAQGSVGKMVKKGTESEAEKAQLEIDSNVKALSSYDLKSVTEGGNVGALVSHAPNFIPGAEESKKNVNNRDAYNAQVRVSIGAGYKTGTSSTEPKNAQTIEKFAKPFEIQPSDNEAQAQQKRDNLVKWLRDNGAAKGAVAPPEKAALGSKFGLKPIEQ